MKLSTLLSSLETYQKYGSSNVVIRGVTDDSRKVSPGDLFVAVVGGHVDSHKFIPQAISKGASAVVGEKDVSKLPSLDGATYIKVGDSRKALALLASGWNGNPKEKLKFVGVTGTDGKTTTATIIYKILKHAGKNVGLISTVSAKIGGKEFDTGFHVTNPEPLPLHKFLSLMVDKGCEWVVLEVTSHGLDQERVFGIGFEVSVLTNITHEHLDYHKTYENYLGSKAKLFNASKVAILNRDDKSFAGVSKLIDKKIETIAYGRNSLVGKVRKAVEERFPEVYNRMNATAAVTVAKELGIDDKDIIHSVESFPGLEGRMQEIKNNKGINIFVDFAHTPNALEQVLSSLKKRKVGKSLIAVFGCAGERDVAKRQIMGEISARLANVSVFTAEDPRSEEVDYIIGQMVEGAQKTGVKEQKIKQFNGSNRYTNKHLFVRIPERGEAIAFAIQKIAKKGDTIVICGKGHEKSMAYGNVEYPWSDQEAVRLALEGEIMRIRRRVHFMGIGGSGMSGVAILAKKMGYEVSGCDLVTETPYLGKVKKNINKIYVGHDRRHLEDADLLVVSPAVFYQNNNHPELLEAEKRGIVLTWQEFLGKELHKGKKVICIAGTHGKSTTAAMAIKLLKDAGLDPSATIGAKLKPAGETFRYGRGEYFITEADEFYDNFLNYHPEIIILNNIEFDHPDYFESEKKVFDSFEKFIGNLTGTRILIANKDSKGVKKLLYSASSRDIRVVFYSIEEDEMRLKLRIPGRHNVQNALGVEKLGEVLGIDKSVIKKSLESFEGIGRRLELLSKGGKVKVYDDYAHHPTAIAATLEGLRELYPRNYIWAVVEAHGFKRTKFLLNLYKGVFKDADRVLIGPIFKARDSETFGMTPSLIAKISGHKNAKGYSSFGQIKNIISKNAKENDVVLVMGAGESYLWSKELSNSFK